MKPNIFNLKMVKNNNNWYFRSGEDQLKFVTPRYDAQLKLWGINWVYSNLKPVHLVAFMFSTEL